MRSSCKPIICPARSALSLISWRRTCPARSGPAIRSVGDRREARLTDRSAKNMVRVGVLGRRDSALLEQAAFDFKTSGGDRRRFDPRSGSEADVMADMSTTREGPLHDGESSDRVLQILDEAARIFASKGYEGASMRDIAVACGISKSLLYHHF